MLVNMVIVVTTNVKIRSSTTSSINSDSFVTVAFGMKCKFVENIYYFDCRRTLTKLD